MSTLAAESSWRGATSSFPLAARVALAVGLPALAALAVVLVSPRGAVSPATGMLVLAAGFAAGLGAGAALRSRWALLLGPAGFALVVELRWVPLSGPSVDAPRFDNGYAILALVLGRGFFGLLAFLPLLVGASLALAALRGRRPGIPTMAGAVAVVALAALVARPASTPPLEGGIASLERIELGGSEQWLQVRGASEDLPVLLYLSGGPGQSDMPQVRATWADLEDDFVIVNLDERGVGKAYGSIDPTSTLTLASAVDDVIELTNVLRARFDEEKVYLVGESWGTLLGVLAAQRAPELFHAYVGSGQMVDIAETDRLLYDDMVAYAERTGDGAAAATMRGYGPPPYGDVFANAYVMGYYDRLAGGYDVPDYAVDRAERFGYGPFGILGSEYSLVEKVNVLRGLMDHFAIMYPQLQELDLRRDVTRLEVPVWLVQGRHELRARTELVPRWLEVLDAPAKELTWFEHAGHATAFEEFRRFETLMTEEVLPATYDPAR